jgi:hypothetical protein
MGLLHLHTNDNYKVEGHSSKDFMDAESPSSDESSADKQDGLVYLFHKETNTLLKVFPELPGLERVLEGALSLCISFAMYLAGLLPAICAQQQG